jgi:hypothetical protein
MAPMRATCPAHIILLDLIILTILVKSSNYGAPHYAIFPQSPATLPVLGPNILLSTLFSGNLRSSINVRDQVSHPYNTTGKIIVLYILIFYLSKF